MNRKITCTLPIIGLMLLMAGGDLFGLARTPAQKVRLLNGLVLIVQEDHGLPLAAVQTVVRAGRVAETRENSGASALLAEVMEREGTREQPGDQFRTSVMDEGSTLEVFSDHETLRIETSCSPDTVIQNLRRQAEMLLTPNLEAEALNRSRKKLLTTLARRDEYPRESGYMREMLAAMLYGDHPYGLPKADPEVVSHLTAEDLEEFRARNVNPDGMRIVVAGDCDLDEVLATVQELYGHLKARGGGGHRLPAIVPLQQPKEQIKFMNVQGAHAAIGFLAPSIFDEDFHAMAVIETLLAQGRTCRLYRRLISQRHLVSAVSSWYPWLPEQSMISFDVACDPSSVEPAVSAMLAQIQRLRTGRIPMRELAKARNYLASRLALFTQRRIVQSQMLGEFDLADDMELFIAFEDEIRQVTPEAVSRAARRWLDPKRYVLAVVKPEGSRGVPESSVWTGKLSNGLKVVLNRDPSTAAVGISIVATVPPGTSRDQTALSQMLAEMLQRGHTARSSSSRTLERLESAGTAVATQGDADGVHLVANASLHNLEAILTVLREIVMEPLFTRHALGDVRRALQSDIQTGAGSPETAGLIRLLGKLYGDHSYGRPLQCCTAAVKEISHKDLKEEHQALFTARNLWIGLAGNITPAEVMPYLEELFGDIKKGRIRKSAQSRFPHREGDQVDTMTHARGDVLYMGSLFSSAGQKEFAALAVVFRVLGLGRSSLLYRALNEAGVLESPAGSRFTFRRDSGQIILGFRLRPGTGRKAQKIAAGVLEKVRAGEFDTSQIEATRKILQGYFMREFEDVQVQASRVVSAASVMGDPEFYQKAGEGYASLTLDSVKSAVRLLDNMQYVIVEQEKK